MESLSTKIVQKNMIEGSIIDGIGHALYCELNFKDGRVTNNNFDKYNLMRFNQAPINIEVFFVENNLSPTGLGEPGLPPAIGALANSLYRVTGKGSTINLSLLTKICLNHRVLFKNSGHHTQQLR